MTDIDFIICICFFALFVYSEWRLHKINRTSKVVRDVLETYKKDGKFVGDSHKVYMYEGMNLVLEYYEGKRKL